MAVPTINNNKIKFYIQGVLNITSEEIAGALFEQGLMSFDGLLSLTDNDLCKLCKRICVGSGLIDNPAYKGGKTSVPSQIKDPGTTIGWLHELRLRQLRYARFHFHRIQRPFSAMEAPMDRLLALWELFLEEKRIKDAPAMDMPDQLTRVENVRDSLEDIQNYLDSTLGAIDAPLAYIIREDIRKPEDRTPPIHTGFGVPSMQEELVDRALHEGVKYHADNAAVWQVIRHVTHGGPAWAWVQGYERTRNGRSAYIALKEHYHGDSFQARTKAAASRTIATLFYDGKARHFPFKKYAQTMNSAFEDMSKCGEPLVEAAKVRHLITGIRDQRLANACDSIMMNKSIALNFQTTVNTLSEVLDRKQSTTSARNIGSMGRGRGGRGNRNNTSNKGGRGGQGKAKKYDPNMVITDRHYTPEEWSVMSAAQRSKAIEMRQERDKRRGVMVVGRNTSSKRPKEDKDDSYQPPATSGTANDQTNNSRQAGIGSMMSRRNQQGQS